MFCKGELFSGENVLILDHIARSLVITHSL
jgi:hypothetical protein